jgi:hypothetical protein
MRSRVLALTRVVAPLLSAIETAAVETPARFAMSRSVEVLMLFSFLASFYLPPASAINSGFVLSSATSLLQ